jgi:magnesium transporter
VNFDYMPELDQPLGYPAVLIVILALCGWLYARFRQAGWL